MTNEAKKPRKFTLIKRQADEPTIVLSSDWGGRAIPFKRLIETIEVTAPPSDEQIHKMAEEYWVKVLGMSEPKYCANSSFEYFLNGFKAALEMMGVK